MLTASKNYVWHSGDSNKEEMSDAREIAGVLLAPLTFSVVSFSTTYRKQEKNAQVAKVNVNERMMTIFFSQRKNVDSDLNGAFKGVCKVCTTLVLLTVVPELVQHSPAP